ncbi:MAG: efflux RND transporter permease subunit [Rhodoluna sp.]|nr:efflux RND transporter permease subunit [Rhodoluna sp.]
MSLANRSVVALVTIIIALFGIVSLGSLKQELIPSFETPQAAIVTTYPGASPQVIDAQVSRPLETAVRALDGLVSSTTTSQNNLSILRVEFDYGTSTAKVKENLSAAIASVEATLPTGASAKVISGSFDSVPIVSLGISSPNNAKIGKLLQEVAPTLFSGIKGVRDVTVSGVEEKRVNIKLDSYALASYGLSQQNIISALKSNGFIVPAGSLTDSKGSISVEVGTEVNSLDAFKSLPLMGTKTSFGMTGPVVSTVAVTIADVADVTYVKSPVTAITRVNGKDALAVSITKTQDGNTVAISTAVQGKVAELAKQLGAGVVVTTIFDQAPYVEQSLHDLTTEGLLGLAFAVLTILVFLLSIRPTLVTAISIPTSLLVTFIGLNLFGYSLNLFTLSALTIAIGRVVDDSIVVIENINRHLSYGEPKKKAILRSVKEVSGAITAATITTVGPFVLLGTLVSGLVGELFKPFAFTFSVALIISLFVALTIVPVLAYWFLKEPKTSKDAEKARRIEEEKERKSILQRAYLPIIKNTQKHPVWTVVASVLIFFLTIGMTPFLKTDFLGSSGSSSTVATQTLSPGATLAEESAAALKVEKLLMADKDVQVVLTTIGSTGDGRVAFGASAGGISHQITVNDGATVADVQKFVEKTFKDDPSLGTVKFSSGGGPGFGSSSTVDIQVTAKSDSALEAGIIAVEKAMKGTKNVTEITNSLATKQRTLKVTVDRLAAARLGLNEITVGGIVAGQMQPMSIGAVNLNGISTNIYVVGADKPVTVQDVRNIAIPTMTGSVSLSSIADVEMTKVPVSITSSKGDRTAKVSLTPQGKNLGALTLDVTNRLKKVALPAGVTATIGGLSQQQADSFSQLGLAGLAGIALVFVVMVGTFRSIRQPLILLVSIPFAATGALAMLLITNTALDISAIIGMLLLVGIVVTNAIVLIDLINQYRKEGRDIHAAIMDGARQRLRPILMTALATIFALTPMALGVTGGGGFISQPLAIVVIGGLFSSTALTLIIVPTLYWIVEGGKDRKAARLAKKA